MRDRIGRSGGCLLYKQLIAVACLAYLSLASATAQPDNDALIAFGLSGMWAADCAERPSSSSPHVKFAIMDGMPTRTVLTGVSQTMVMRNLRMIAPDRLGYYLQAPSKEWHYRVVARVGQDIRNHEAIGPDGTAVIKDGKYVASGAPTPLYRRCSDRT